MLDMRGDLPDAGDPRVAMVDEIKDAILNTTDRVVVYPVSDALDEENAEDFRLLLVAIVGGVNLIKLLCFYHGVGSLSAEDSKRTKNALCFLNQRNVEIRKAEPWMLA